MTGPDPLDASSLLSVLARGGVDYIVIGGLAVGAHGYPRATKDIDIVPAPDEVNLERLAAALSELDYEIIGGEGFESEELVHPDLQGLLAGGSWVLRTRFGRLDVLQHVEPDIDYSVLEAESITDEVFGNPVRFCGYRHLIAMKEAAGRDQDRVDLARLRMLHEDR